MVDDSLLMGVNPIIEKLKTSPEEVSLLFLARGNLRPILKLIESDARRLKIAINYLEAKELDRLAHGGIHQGVLARVQAYSYASFSQLEETVTSAPSADVILILDGIMDPRNFGAILRTAEAVGVRHVIIPKDRSVGITPVVYKASAGAISYLRVYRVVNLRRALSSLKTKGFWIVGLAAEAKQDYDAQRYPRKLGIVLGGEGRGIRPLISKGCDYLVRIPMKGKVSSLNVSVAGAVLLYEVLRQQSGIHKDRPVQ